MASVINKSQLKDPIVFIALGLGSGLTPKAPGTAGTVLAIPLYLLMQPLTLTSYAIITFALIIAGIWICGYATRKLGVHDHPGIVFDEIAGFLVTMFAAPSGWLWLVVGFVLFRFFDAVKPWPVSWFDKNLKGGFGIMIDDIVAGGLSFAVIQISVRLF